MEPLASDAAGDEAVVDEIVRLINDAYATGEAEFWEEGRARTVPAEVAEAIRGGEMLVAALEDRIVGCARVRTFDPSMADLSVVSAVPDQWGSGVGRALVRRAEELMRLRGVTTMQLDLLVPVGWTHPRKDQLRAWYVRLGYRVVSSVPFEELVPDADSMPIAPCEVLVFRKSLGETL